MTSDVECQESLHSLFCRYGFIETNSTDGKLMCDLHWKIQICKKNAIIQPAQKRAPNIESRNQRNQNGVLNSSCSQNQSNYNRLEKKSSHHQSAVGQLNDGVQKTSAQSSSVQKDYPAAGACSANFNASSASVPSDLPPLELIGSGREETNRSKEESLPPLLSMEKRSGGI